MKFFSKHSNFRLVLKHGLPGEPMTGRAAVPGVYVKFENGEVTVTSQEIIDMLLAHRGFGTDFVSQDTDPFAKTRKGAEPEHDMVSIEYGHVGRNANPRPGKNAEVIETAKIMAKEMAKEIVKEMLAEAKNEAEAQQPAPIVEVPKTPEKTETIEQPKAKK